MLGIYIKYNLNITKIPSRYAIDTKNIYKILPKYIGIRLKYISIRLKYIPLVYKYIPNTTIL